MISTTETFSAPRFLAIDFFCGAGGTSRGFIDAGGHVIAGVDKEGECKVTFESNLKNSDGSHAKYLQRDIFQKSEDYPDGEQDVLIDELSELLAEKRVDYPNVPLMFSICAPCQPFTTISRVIGENREIGRSRDRNLLHQSLDFVDKFNPEMILCENVQGIQDKKYGGVWQAFMAELKDRGYFVGSAIVDAVNYGIPQHRKRSILLAVKGDATDLDAMTIAVRDNGDIIVPLKDGSAPTVTVKEAIGHLPPLQAGGSDVTIPNHLCGKVTEINRQRLQHISPGGNNLEYNGTGLELACHTRMRERAGTPRSGYTDSYTRLSGDKPAPAITTKCYSFTNGRYGHFDPKQVRALSIREAAILQSFPDDYVFHSKAIARAARMVGNAVPPKLGKFFAEELMGYLKQA